MTDDRKAFDGLLQIGWDNTSLDLFRTCPRKYYYAMILQRTSPIESVDLRFGVMIHRVLEFYDKQRVSGVDHERAQLEAVRLALEISGDRAEVAGATRFQPWHSMDPQKNRLSFIRTVVWYTEQFQEDPLETVVLPDGRPAVELSFRMELPSVAGHTFYYCGHIDRLVRDGSGIAVLDHKTTKHALSPDWAEQWSPDGQMSGYAVGAKVFYGSEARGVFIDAMQIGASFTRFHRYVTTRSPEQLDEFIEGVLYWIGQAKVCAESEAWPMNESGCSKYGGCMYRRVCAQSPAMRSSVLRNFVPKKWDPFEPR